MFPSILHSRSIKNCHFGHSTLRSIGSRLFFKFLFCLSLRIIINLNISSLFVNHRLLRNVSVTRQFLENVFFDFLYRRPLLTSFQL